MSEPIPEDQAQPFEPLPSPDPPPEPDPPAAP
jgi:hypothetical protein